MADLDKEIETLEAPDLTAELDAAEDIVMSRAETPAADAAPIVLSVAFQMGPLWRPDRPGVPHAGSLEKFAEDMTRYLAVQLERFGDQRGADLFLSVVAQRGDERAGQEYRSGHYVKDASPLIPAPECPESKMGDGRHAADYEDSGSCPWCGAVNPGAPR